jgi:hypothetical protein
MMGTSIPPGSPVRHRATDGLSRSLAAVSDYATSAAAGRRLHLRLGLSLREAAVGRIDRVRLTAHDVDVGGLTLTRVAIDARRVTINPGWPPRLRTGMVRIRAEIDQAALDAWVRGAALPVRLRLRTDGLAVRAGLRGIRLVEVRATLAVHDRLLMITPHRGEVLGVGVSAPRVGVPLPLPPLPRGTRATSVEVGDRRASVGLEVPSLDEPVQADGVATVLRLLGRPRRGRAAPADRRRVVRTAPSRGARSSTS